MNSIRRFKKGSTRRRASRTKRRNSKPKSRSKSRSKSAKPTRVVFVNGKARIARPKANGSGYFYIRKSSSGKLYKVSISSKTYSPKDARKKIISLKKKSRV